MSLFRVAGRRIADLEAERDEALVEAGELRVEVDRLTDGIRDINRMLRNSRYAEARQHSRSLLDVAGDDALDEIVRVSEDAGLYNDREDGQ